MMGATISAVLRKKDIRRDTLVKLDLLLENLFIVSPDLPIIRTHPTSEYVHLDEVYRQFVYFLHEWALSAQGYRLQHNEIRILLLRAAKKYGKTVESVATTATEPG